MSREAFGDPPESQEPPQVCPVCGGEWHAEDCDFGKEVALRLKAERDAHRMQFALHRLWPALERAMSGLVFTADRAGEVQADMNTLREYSKTQEQAPGCKTPAGCSENGCLGWCDEHRPDRPPTPVGWSDTDWLKHLEEIQQDQAVYHRGPLPETGWD